METAIPVIPETQQLPASQVPFAANQSSSQSSTVSRTVPHWKVSPKVEVQRIRDFIIAHHRKISQGDIKGMVADYHTSASYFDKGQVSRDFIFNEELSYHSKYYFVYETVTGEPFINILPDGNYEVEYPISIKSRARATNETGQSDFRVTLELTITQSGLRIVRHTCVKKS